MKLTAGKIDKSLGITPVLLAVVACPTYAILWVVLWELSQAFWFLPAGLRFVALLYTTPSKWPILVIGEWLAIYYLIGEKTAGLSIIEHGITNYTPVLIYALAVGFLLKKPKLISNETPIQSTLAAVFTAAILASTANAIVLHAVMPHTNPTLVFEGYSVAGIASYTLGDVAGILFAVSATEFARSLRWFGRTESQRLVRSTVFFVGPILLLTVWLPRLFPDVEWEFLAAMFIPIVFLSIRHGWSGATLSVVFLNITAGIIYFLIGDSEWLFHSQIFLVSVGITGLFLGSAISRQAVLVEDIRNISQRVIDTQENERSRISRDLHDHVGQILTALRSRIAVLQRSDALDSSCDLSSLDQMAADAYQEVHNIVEELSPKELALFGLKKTLDSAVFHKMLGAANIDYQPTIANSLSDISEPTRIAIYRISQEALSNVAKHSKATECSLKIYMSNSPGSKAVQIEIRDNGIGFNLNRYTVGHGLQNIEDRIHALGGRFQLNSGNAGTRIVVAIPA